jgi:hypothetical protein
MASHPKDNPRLPSTPKVDNSPHSEEGPLHPEIPYALPHEEVNQFRRITGTYCYNPKFHYPCLPSIMPTHCLPCQSHTEQTLQKPHKSSNPRPNLALGALGRWQSFCSTRVNAGWPTTAHVYLTKKKIRKVSAGTKSFLSVNWNSQPCMAESSPKTLAPSSL